MSRVTTVALVPCRNGADRIETTVRSLSSLGLAEVIVIDDGSSDRTGECARSAGARVVSLPVNLGKGGALAAGLEAAPESTETFLLVDADTAETAAAVEPALRLVESGEADLAVGTLPSAGGRAGFGTVKRFASSMIRRCCGFEAAAPLSGQRAIRAELLRSIKLVPRFGVEVGMTVDAVRKGARVVEVPVAMDHSHTGRSFAGFVHRGRQGRDVLRALWPRVVGRGLRTGLALVCLALVACVLLSVGQAPSSSGQPVSVDNGQVRVVMVPGLQWPGGEDWQLPPAVSAGSVVSGSDDPIRTAATGKAEPKPEHKTLVQVQLIPPEEFAGASSLAAQPGETVFVAGFNQPGEALRERPLLMLGSGQPAGELTSASTKRPGLVDLRDLSALVDGVASEGSPVRVDQTVRPEPALLGERAQQSGFYDRNNPVLIGCYVGFICLLAVLAVLSRRWKNLDVRGGATAVAAVPVGALFMRWWTPATDLGLLTWSALLAAVVGMIVVMAGRGALDVWTPLRRVALLTVVVLVVDAATGTHLQQSGMFGSSPSLGARYYGFGNPATTVLLMAAVTWSALHVKNLAQPVAGRPWFALAAVWLVVTAAIGLPGMGADAGGLVVSAALGSAAVALSLGLRVGWARGSIALLAGLMTVVAAGILDAGRSASDRTHLGALFADVAGSGPGVLLEFATNRVEINLFGYGFPWSMLVPAAVVAFAVWLLRRPETVAVMPRGSSERIGALGCFAGALGLWLLNDSGVVVLALAAVFVVPLIVLCSAEAQASASSEVRVG